MSIEPELGQIVFGNPTGEYGTYEYVDALIDALLNEIERVYWNETQEEWNRSCDPKMKGLEFRRYYWGDDEEEVKKPNLKFDFSPQEVRWYKYPGRGQNCSIEWNEKEWREWFDKGLEVIRSNEKDLF